MNRRIALLLFIILICLIGGLYWFSSQRESQTNDEQVIHTMAKRDFIIDVKATGELKAKNSKKIKGPQGMRSVRIYQTNITDLVPEGTVVKKGDYIGALDKTELDQKIREVQSEIDEINTQLDQAIIDTALEMQDLNNQIVNLKFSMDEKRLEVEQSRYEPQMVVRQAELDLQRTERDYNQLKAKINLSRERSVAKISEIKTRLYQKQLRLNQMLEISGQFRIKAPDDGMVIYARSWNGKVGPGSQISTWDPVVAELPDLTDMISKTYVNEIDISRVHEGQEVELQVDAFPDETYNGIVTSVANIGEQLRGYDAKVFEVIVQMLQTDSILRPAMTTSNRIVTDVIPGQLAIPLEALHGDTLSYVYVKDGPRLVKREVIPGLTNTDEVIIDHGLAEGDEVYLSVPEKTDNLPFEYIDQSIKQEIKQRQLALQAEKDAERKKRMESLKGEKAKPAERETNNSYMIIME